MTKSLWCSIALALNFVSFLACAQEVYPSAPIKLVIGFPPGATTDIVARSLAQKLTAQLNANVIVENKPGANANIAAEYVAKSKADGYTLLLNTPSVVLSRAFGETTGYDLFNDLAPVALVTSAPQLIVAHPSVRANTLPEFIALLRANPGKFSYGSAGNGSLIHLGMLLFLQANGLTALHVPYKGSAPALIDVVAGQVQFAMQGLTAALPMIKDKRVKVVAVASLQRSPLLPEVATISETMPGFEIGTWSGVMAPSNTALPILRKLNGEIGKAMQDRELRSRLALEGVEPFFSTREEYAAYLKNEVVRWTNAIRIAGVRPE